MTYVMSDIHGYGERFENVMKKINLQPNDNLHVLALEESKNKSRCLTDSIEDFQRKFAMGKDLYERQ